MNTESKNAAEKPEETVTPSSSPESQGNLNKSLTGSPENLTAGTGTGSVTDSSGNIYVVSNNSNNIYLVMYNSSGNKQWTRQYGTTENDQVDGFAIDFLGNIYMTGSTYGGLNGNTNSGKSDIEFVFQNQ